MTISKFFAPATSANLAAGYEIFGLALEQPGDIVTAEKTQQSGVQLLSITGDDNKLPKDAAKNTATVAASALAKHLGYDGGIGIHLEKNLPLCSGMGSSAASSAAAVAAVNHLLGAGLTNKQLVPFAMEGERIACGSAHADNVAPSLMGGLVLVRSYQPLDLISIKIPDNLHYAIVSPDILVSTAESRAKVPTQISISNAVAQMGNAAAFIAALAQDDYEMLASAAEDFIAEPARACLIPGFSLVKQAALQSGAAAAGLSGSGPSMFALSDCLETAQNNAQEMAKIFTTQQIKSTSYFGAVSQQGARLVDAG
jgi:homoserine kinase